MTQENIAKNLITVSFSVTKASAKFILDTLKNGYNISKNSDDFRLDTSKKCEMKTSDLIDKGSLNNITIASNFELKELKKELNKLGVKFSIERNKTEKTFEVLFQAKDINVLDVAFKNAIYNYEKKENFKQSTKEKIKKFKEHIYKNMYQAKEKFRNKEMAR